MKTTKGTKKLNQTLWDFWQGGYIVLVIDLAHRHAAFFEPLPDSLPARVFFFLSWFKPPRLLRLPQAKPETYQWGLITCLTNGGQQVISLDWIDGTSWLLIYRNPQNL